MFFETRTSKSSLFYFSSSKGNIVLKTVLLDFEYRKICHGMRFTYHWKSTKNIFSRLCCHMCGLSCPRSRKIVTLKSSFFINSFPSGRALWFLTLVTFLTFAETGPSGESYPEDLISLVYCLRNRHNPSHATL